MKPARLLIAAVLLGGLGVALWWSNKEEKAKEGKPAADAPPRILAIPADTVKKIEIRRRGEEPFAVQANAAGKWEITQPKSLPADTAAVESIASAASKLDSERMVDANATDLPSYGLAPGMIEVAFTQKDGKASKLLIGESTPTGSAVYAKLDGDPRLFTMAAASKTTFDKTLQDLRDKHLLSIAQDKLNVLVVTARNQSTELTKPNDGDWKITKPRAMRADGIQVSQLVDKINSASMTGDAEAAQFASATLVATVAVTDGGAAKTLEIRKNKDDYFAKSSTLTGVYRTTKDVADGLDKIPDDFRTKKLFSFGFGEPTRIEVIDGAKTSLFEKQGDKWTSAGKTMDATSVQQFIDKLRDLSASKFIDAGFTTTVVTINVSSDQGKRKEKVELAASADKFLGRHDDDSSVYELDGNVVKDLRQAVGDVREEQKPPAAKSK